MYLFSVGGDLFGFVLSETHQSLMLDDEIVGIIILLEINVL